MGQCPTSYGRPAGYGWRPLFNAARFLTDRIFIRRLLLRLNVQQISSDYRDPVTVQIG